MKRWNNKDLFKLICKQIVKKGGKGGNYVLRGPVVINIKEE